MTNATNDRQALTMLSAEPLEREYLDEFSPRMAAKPQLAENLAVAPAWFPAQESPAAIVAQLQPQSTRVDSVVIGALMLTAVAGVGYFVGWEIGAFLLAAFGVQAISSLPKNSKLRRMLA